MTARARVRAPELVGKGGWLNTGDRRPTLADLRGSIVILDFWTFCCVNCLHVLDELRELEERHRDTVVIVGVHSPKFVHEAEHQAVVDAVERYGVHHPVLDDPELSTWQPVRGPRLADTRGDRPRGVRRRAARRRGARARAGEARHRAGDRSTPPRAPCGAATGRTSRRSRSRPICASPARRWRCRARGTTWCPTRPGTRWWSWPPTARAWCAGSAAASAAWSTGTRRPRGSASRRAWRCCRTAPWWSPTPSTTRCAGWTWRAAGSPRWPAPAGSGGRARPPSGAGPARWTCPRRGTWPGSRTGCGSPWRACTSCGRTTRRRTGSRSPRAPPTRAWSTGTRPTPGSPSRPACRRPAAGCGSPTPRRRRCAGWSGPRTAAATWSAPRSAPACSTSATGTARPGRRCSSTRWASPRCRTARSRSATRTTTRCAATTR